MDPDSFYLRLKNKIFENMPKALRYRYSNGWVQTKADIKRILKEAISVSRI